MTRKQSRWRRFGRNLLIVGVLLVGLNLSLRLLADWCYRGPRTLTQTIAVMPGVPIFPLAKLAPNNHGVQRALAIPIWFLRFQGAREVEAVQLLAPGDAFYIVDWYREISASQDWQIAGLEQTTDMTRLVFTRDQAGLQVIIGSSDGLYTPVQLLYLGEMTPAQLADLTDQTVVVEHPVQDEEPAPVTPAVKPPDVQPPAPTPAPVAKPVVRRRIPAPRPQPEPVVAAPAPVVTPKPEPVVTPKPEPVPVATPPQTPPPPVAEHPAENPSGYVKPEKGFNRMPEQEMPTEQATPDAAPPAEPRENY